MEFIFRTTIYSRTRSMLVRCVTDCVCAFVEWKFSVKLIWIVSFANGKRTQAEMPQKRKKITMSSEQWTHSIIFATFSKSHIIYDRSTTVDFDAHAAGFLSAAEYYEKPSIRCVSFIFGADFSWSWWAQHFIIRPRQIFCLRMRNTRILP